MDRARVLRYLAAAVVTLAIGQGVAIAQSPPATPPAGDPGTDVNAGLQRQANLSPKEQLTQADSDLARMEQSRSTVRRQLMEAREKRDVVKTLCLNDKLTQLNVAVTSAQERRDALAAAAKRGEADLATHEFTILSVLRQRADQLSTEANQCIGEEVGVVGQSSVTVDITDLPEEDPSEYPNFGVVVEPPTCSSCYN
ncbi:MAG: hypothetical protein JNL21_32470 [Myxococcales bacterium]|nr:hypothetical protein [Myxococcales bacterium]